MEPLFQHIWTTELARALCLTLLHSLWQGLLLALLAAFMIQLSPKTSPGKRYNLFALLLGLFTLASGFTFLLCFKHTGAADQGLSLAAATEAQGVTDLLQTLWMQLTGFIDRNAAVLSLLWLALFSFRSIRLTQEARSLRGLRKNALHLQDDYWTERLAVLKTRLGIRDEVAIRESGRLQSPSVVGILKPVILLPLGMLSQLPPEQIEAILLHELAHMLTYIQYKRGIQPHGKEWKAIFAGLLSKYMGRGIFPDNVEEALTQSLSSIKASTCSDPNLYRALKKHDRRQKFIRLVEDIPLNEHFQTLDGRTFQKIEKLRTRFRCREVKTGHLYLFPAIAEVKLVQVQG